MTDRARNGVRAAAVVVPIAVAAGAVLLRDVLANTSAALVLVLVIVAVAVAGDRVAGVVAAVVSAAAFDFFLTAPYYAFAILDRDDIETAILLVAVGIAVTEVAQWGRRQQARSGRREGHLTGVARAARMAAGSADGDELVATVERMIADVLDLDECHFTAAGPDGERPVLRHDGAVVWHGRSIDVEREGLPTMDVVELPAGRGSPTDGRFLLTASSRVRRPDLEQRQVAVTLAEQVGSAATSSVRGGS